LSTLTQKKCTEWTTVKKKQEEEVNFCSACLQWSITETVTYYASYFPHFIDQKIVYMSCER